jgi:O-Antigen ligase
LVSWVRLVRDRTWHIAPDVLVVAGASLVALVGALAVVSGRGFLAIAVAVVPVGLFVLPRLSRAAGLPAGYFAIEVPAALLLLSTLTFRSRDAEALATNPLDSAAIVRVGCIGAAALLAWMTLLRRPMTLDRVATPSAVLVYAAYVAVVFLGAPLSQDLSLTAYRGVELAVGVLVVVSAIRFGGPDAVRRLENLVFAFVLFIVCSIWLGVMLVPGQALDPEGVGPFPYLLTGVFPAVSPNTVGMYGAVLLLWSLGIRLGARRGSRWYLFFVVLGALTLLGAQYRTGYLATVVAFTLLLATRGRKTLAAVAATVALVGGVANSSSIIHAAEPYALRGQTPQQAGELSGRISFWKKAIPVWKESPIVGKGLLTATRFEVLAPLGYTSTSTIHGTWIEALVGTGVLGVGLLATFLLLMWRSALPDLLARDGLVYPGLLLIFFTVRSITGQTFEAFSDVTLVFLVLAYVLAEAKRRRGLLLR